MPFIHPYILRSIAILICMSGFYIVSSFLPAFLWALIAAIATWPIYRRIRKHIRYKWLSATVMTLLMTVIGGGILYAFTVHAFQESLSLFEYLQSVAAKGISAPDFIKNLPIIGKKVHQWWTVNLQASGAGLKYVQQFLSSESWDIFIQAQTLGGVLARKGATLAFSLIILYCLYYSGTNWSIQLNERGVKFFGYYWKRYIESLDISIRAIANGLFLVASIEAIGMSVAYYFADLPSVLLMGTLTGILSIVPLVSPLFVLCIMLYLWVINDVSGFIIVFTAGVLFLGIFDNWARPYLIGSSIQLPFLPVFFGILGGIETMGLIGLFIGPIIMVLVHKIWQDLMNISHKQNKE